MEQKSTSNLYKVSSIIFIILIAIILIPKENWTKSLGANINKTAAVLPTPSISISALPNPCLLASPTGTCSTTISFTTDTLVQVRTSSGALFACKGPGTWTQTANSIGANPVIFSVYRANDCLSGSSIVGSAIQSVTVFGIGAFISVANNIVPFGGSTVVTWKSVNTQSCTELKNNQPWHTSLSGSATLTNITSPISLSMSCTGYGGSISNSNITETSATLFGNVEDIGTATLIRIGFHYGRHNQTLSLNVSTTTHLVAGAYSLTVNNLLCGTAYDYKSYAINSVGEGDGLIQSFTTTACSI